MAEIITEKKLIRPNEIRVRIAPSPTGFLHIGGARTALFNYLFAKKNQGSFILRIEDTDLERSDQKFEKDIIENLKWLGIQWSEGPDIGGDYGPYKQSERTGIYTKYLKKLLDENKAYYCFCSEEDLETQKQYQMSIGESPHYSGKCANLTEEIIKNSLVEKKSSVIRFRVNPKKIIFNDIIRGRLEFDTSLFGDIVIAKNISAPLYNFAVVIDDFEMKISHIIRGEEHISNTPKQILIQEALGFPQLKYTHPPLILAPDKSKLSKRYGAFSVLEYKKAGYLPESLINFMAFLGWNPGNKREIYSMASLVKEFSLERAQKGGAIFNINRLDYLNGFYIRQKSIEKLTELCIPYLIEAGLITSTQNFNSSPENLGNVEKLKLSKENGLKFKGDKHFSWGEEEICLFTYVIKETNDEISLKTLKKIVSIYQERLKKLSEISELTNFFFKDKLKHNKDLLRWKETPDKEIKNSLDKLEKILSKIKKEDFNKENLERILMSEAEKTESRGALLWPLRVALTNKQASAGPLEIAEILEKEKTLKRLKEARKLF